LLARSSRFAVSALVSLRLTGFSCVGFQYVINARFPQEYWHAVALGEPPNNLFISQGSSGLSAD
jgi:hypothetical protein